jgi:hypothetical protein
MRTEVAEHKGAKIWVDENGQFWIYEPDGSKRFWNPGTPIQAVKEEIDFLEAYEKAVPVKVLRIEFPYLQVWNIRKVTRKRYGYDHAGWYTKDDPHHGPDHEQYPRDFYVRDAVVYDESVHRECERRFKEMRDSYARISEIKRTMALEK